MDVKASGSTSEPRRKQTNWRWKFEIEIWENKDKPWGVSPELEKQQRSEKILQELHERPETLLPASCWNCNKNSGRSEKDASELENTSLCQKNELPHTLLPSPPPSFPLALAPSLLHRPHPHWFCFTSSHRHKWNYCAAEVEDSQADGGPEVRLNDGRFTSRLSPRRGKSGRGHLDAHRLPRRWGRGGGVESIGWNLFNYGREAGGDEEGEGGGASQEESRRGGRFSKLACSLALNTQWKLCHSRESVCDLFTRVDRSGRQTQILDMNSITFCKTNQKQPKRFHWTTFNLRILQKLQTSSRWPSAGWVQDFRT